MKLWTRRWLSDYMRMCVLFLFLHIDAVQMSKLKWLAHLHIDHFHTRYAPSLILWENVKRSALTVLVFPKVHALRKYQTDISYSCARKRSRICDTSTHTKGEDVHMPSLRPLSTCATSVPSKWLLTFNSWYNNLVIISVIRYIYYTNARLGLTNS